MRHPAWGTLSPPAFKIIGMLLASYRPANPNKFPVGERRMADLCGCAPATARKAIDELVAGSFLKEERKGRSRGNVASRERVASLTRYNTDTTVGDPDLPLKAWEKRMKSRRHK
jgi:hypothetical protein